MKKIIFTLITLFFTNKVLLATHLAGAFITYTHDSALTYKVNLQLLADCTGAPLGGTATVEAYSASLGTTLSVIVDTFNTGGPIFTGSLCPTGSTQCTNMNSTLPGYVYIKYAGTLTLPAAAADWIFVYSGCCRNFVVQNIGPNGFAVYAKLNNSVSPNNGIQFQNAYNLVSGSGVLNTYSTTAYEQDGDSLDFSLTDPLDNVSSGTPIPYTQNPGFSATSPFGAGNSISINNLTGQLSYTCNTSGGYVIAIKVDEYRNGIIVGSNIIDLQLVFLPGVSNSLPTLSGINNTNAFVTNVTACQNVSFTVNSTDLNVGDSTRLELISNQATAALTTTNTQIQNGTFNWTPTAADVSSLPHVFYIKVLDNACPINGENIYTYLVYVNQCNTDTVWAGDANADFIVNNMDMLALGIANGATGVVRPNATTTWQPEFCTNWLQSFVSGNNYKHADCDGNGTVNIAVDQNAITNNYGQFHNKKDVEGKNTRALPEFYVDTTGIQLIPGSTVSLPIMLGTLAHPISNFYGVASTLELVNGYSQNALQINKSGSWLAANTVADFNKTIGTTRADFAITKHNQTNSNGYGQIGTLTFTVAANAVPGSIAEFKLLNTKVINKNGGEILVDFPLTQAIIQTPNSIKNIVFQNITIAPNPAKEHVQIYIGGNETYTVTLINNIGQKLYSAKVNATHFIDTKNLARGLYYLQIADAKNNLDTRKLILN